MRIAFDHQIFGWQEYGGISRYAYDLASRLSASPDCDVVVASPFYVNRYLSNALPCLRVVGIPAPSFPHCGRIYRAVNYWLTRLFLIHFRPDIVHETYYASMGCAPKSAKVVLTVYDMIHEKFSENFSTSDPTRREKAAAVRRADHIICISNNTKQDLVRILSVDPNKISVVHLGVSLPVKDIGTTIEALQSRPFLLYVGNRGGHKNFDAFITAIAQSPRLKNDYDIVCFGGGAFNASEKELIERLGFSSGKVRQVSGGDVVLSGLYRRARAFVYPSLYEGFGIPPLEAMSVGCPVVCSNTSSILEVVSDAGALFDPYDIRSMQSAIERVSEDEIFRQQLISKGRGRVKKFTQERCTQETIKVYQKVLSGGTQAH